MIYQNIVESEEHLKFIFSAANSGFDINSKRLLNGLLTNRPYMRLGMLRDGVDEIWAFTALKSKDTFSIFNSNNILHTYTLAYSSLNINSRSVGAPYM